MNFSRTTSLVILGFTVLTFGFSLKAAEPIILENVKISDLNHEKDGFNFTFFSGLRYQRPMSQAEVDRAWRAGSKARFELMRAEQYNELGISHRSATCFLSYKQVFDKLFSVERKEALTNIGVKNIQFKLLPTDVESEKQSIQINGFAGSNQIEVDIFEENYLYTGNTKCPISKPLSKLAEEFDQAITDLRAHYIKKQKKEELAKSNGRLDAMPVEEIIKVIKAGNSSVGIYDPNIADSLHVELIAATNPAFRAQGSNSKIEHSAK